MVIKKADTDIDIDFQNPKKALEGLEYTRAVLIDDDDMISPHKSGVYFQDIPFDSVTGLATISSKEAEDRGYFKLDFLRVHQYDGVRDEEHLDELMKREPLWEMLEDEFFVKQLSQIHGHYDLISAHKPTSVEQLAMLLSIIRPAKQHLQGLDWSEIEKNVWNKPQIGDKGYEYKGSFFKKPHSIAYSLGIVVQMNLIVENLS